MKPGGIAREGKVERAGNIALGVVMRDVTTQNQ